MHVLTTDYQAPTYEVIQKALAKEHNVDVK